MSTYKHRKRGSCWLSCSQFLFLLIDSILRTMKMLDDEWFDLFELSLTRKLRKEVTWADSHHPSPPRGTRDQLLSLKSHSEPETQTNKNNEMLWKKRTLYEICQETEEGKIQLKQNDQRSFRDHLIYSHVGQYMDLNWHTNTEYLKWRTDLYVLSVLCYIVCIVYTVLE